MAKLPVSNAQKTERTGVAASGGGRHLKQQFKAGAVLVGGTGTEYLRPSLVKLYKQAGFDFLYIEYEHCFFSMTTLADTVLCARDNGLPVIAKTPQLERAEVAKLLESGIVGIQLPRTESRADVETLRSYLKFPPYGTRAIAPGYGSSGYVQPPDWGAWMREQNEETCLVVHIETRRGYEHAEEIISTTGVDMVYVGPGDFSIEMGHPGDYDHPDVAGPLREILAICKKYKVPFGTTASSPAAAGQLVKLGAQFFEASDELALILEAAQGLVGAYRQFCP
ncbi:MAG: aldolase/citrate lyase family protein [Chloroflexi bacterium]|nr:aldolase/citrate lyase family protein [Chloroflexota bacterium]